jgi:RNA 3'-terminal phosphate cyclase (ATP)
MLTIDGREQEGGGQILRTSLSLAALTGRPFRITNIRANRAKSGLRPQHLTAVRAAAILCQAHLKGDSLNATTLEFHPQVPPTPGEYHFDVSEVAKGGSAGSVMLIFQTVIWPLLFANGRSRLNLRGGTHVPFSPPYHYVAEVFRPLLCQMGATFTTNLDDWGWYPAGGGFVTATIEPIRHLQAIPFGPVPAQRVEGVAAVSNLPGHIPQRMADHAASLLQAAGLPSQIEVIQEQGQGPGAGIVLWLPQAGFTSIGRRGLPAEEVAQTAVAECLAFLESHVQVDSHLADQLLLPCALARGSTSYTTHSLTQHALTQAQLLRQWLDVAIEIEGLPGQPAQITVSGINYTVE